jgi:lipid II:glycine glycyltransferase (peptidoglycan interpeptide bridge formation enzyme)
MEYALQNGLQHFDFMGLGKPDEPYKVREFKTKFGKNIVNYGRFGRKSNPFLYSIAEMAYNILRLFRKV